MKSHRPLRDWFYDACTLELATSAWVLVAAASILAACLVARRFGNERPPAPEFRRAMFKPVDAVDIRVQFAPERSPLAVYYTEWPALDAPPGTRVRADLEADHSVHTFLRMVENAIVGYSWDW